MPFNLEEFHTSKTSLAEELNCKYRQLCIIRGGIRSHIKKLDRVYREAKRARGNDCREQNAQIAALVNSKLSKLKIKREQINKKIKCIRRKLNTEETIFDKISRPKNPSLGLSNLLNC